VDNLTAEQGGGVAIGQLPIAGATWKTTPTPNKLYYVIEKHLQKHNAIKHLAFVGPDDMTSVKDNANLVLVLVEKRLLSENIERLSYAEDWLPTNTKPWIGYYKNLKLSDYDLHPHLTLWRDAINNTRCDFYDYYESLGIAKTYNVPEHYTASLIETTVYAGNKHQDGRTLLDLRDFLIDVKAAYPNFRGVILVGAFPEALIRRKRITEVVPKTGGYSTKTEEEVLAYRSDIVLADLSGHWDKIYRAKEDDFYIDDSVYEMEFTSGAKPEDIKVKKIFQPQYLYAFKNEVGDQDKYGVWPPLSFNPGLVCTGQGTKQTCVPAPFWEQTAKKYKTWGLQAWIPEDPYSVVGLVGPASTPDEQEAQYGVHLNQVATMIADAQGNLVEKVYYVVQGTQKKFEGPIAQLLFERGQSEQLYMPANREGIQGLNNPIAVPDILVSRINARNIAISVHPDWYSKNTFYSKYAGQRWPFTVYDSFPVIKFCHDPVLERELLIGYFMRNWNYRHPWVQPRACASVAYWDGKLENTSGVIDNQKVFREYWLGGSTEQVDFPDCTSFKFIDFLKEDAELKMINLHGGLDRLKTKGPVTFDFLRSGYEQRTWRFGKLQDKAFLGSFFWTISSHANTPWGAEAHPYNSSEYGKGQISEALLFCGNGLAIIGRAHTHYNPPGYFLGMVGNQGNNNDAWTTFEWSLLRGMTFGEMWRARFEAERTDGARMTMAGMHLQKESYRFGILGDWTLRVNQ